LAKNEVGVSEPLETEEPYTVQKPMGKPHVFMIFLIVGQFRSFKTAQYTYKNWEKKLLLFRFIHQKLANMKLTGIIEKRVFF